MAESMYYGNCHCGANRYQVELPTVKSAVACNCRSCSKNGLLWKFVPECSLCITKGDLSTLVQYESCGTVSYKFCGSCGTALLGTHAYQNGSTPLFGINVRALSTVNPLQLEIATDMQLRKEASKSNPCPADMSLSETSYYGSCVCGKVSLSLRSQPLQEVEIKEDNCSICVRNAFVGVYAHNRDVRISGREHTKEYLFANRFNGHPFCETCGVQVFQNPRGPPPEVAASFSEARQEMIKRKLEIQPVNVRVLDDVAVADLRVIRKDEGTDGYSI